MKKFLEYERVIATIEKSGGNAEVGDMWTETHSFPKKASAEEIVGWAMDNQCSGKLIITIDASTGKNDAPF